MDQTAQTDLSNRGDQTGAAGMNGASADFGDLIQVFWRRKMLMIGSVAFVTGLAALIAFQIPPQYTASARLMIHPINPQAALSAFDGTASSLLRNNRSTIYGEIEVMKSDRLIEKTVARLGLDDDQEFNPSLRSGMFAALSTLEPVRWLLAALGPATEAIETDAERDQQARAEIVANVRERLTIRPPGLPTRRA